MDRHYRLLGIVCMLTLGTACPQRIDPKRSDTHVNLAREHQRNGELEGARSELRKALAYDPKNEEAHNQLGLVWLELARRNTMLLEVNDCLTGIDAEAIRSEMTDALTRAREEFSAAIGADDEFGEGWANRGAAAMLLGEYAVAQADFQHALENPERLIDPGLTRSNLGWSYFLSEQWVPALKELRQSAQLNPGSCLANFRLGRVYFQRQEWDKAREHFVTSVADPECAKRLQESHLFLMKTDLQLGRIDDARTHQANCVRIGPKSCVAQQCRSILP